jgi:hypothetical protein
MTIQTGTKENLDQSFHTLTHPRHKPKVEERSEEHGQSAPAHDRERPRKHFHAHELHDGTYHVERDHGEGPMETGSANDLDEVHDHLEEMMGEPNEGEQEAGHGETRRK